MNLKKIKTWWSSEGVIYAVAALVLLPGVAAAVVEWVRMHYIPLPERVMCCFGAGCLTSTFVMVAVALAAHRKEAK